MGCEAKTKDILEDSLTEKILKNIHDNLEANLVNQSTLNLELKNIYKKFGNKSNTPENIIRAYCELLLNLTKISNDQEKAEIKDLLFSFMNVSYNHFFQFYILLYRKLQGMKDYSNIKTEIENDASIKNCIKRSHEILMEVFDILKQQKIIYISQLTSDKFKKAVERRGVKMKPNQITAYYKLLVMKPKDYSAINDSIRKELVEHKNMKKNIEKYGEEIKNLLENIIKERIDYENIDLESFNEMAKKFDVELEYFELEEIYILMQKNYLDFICLVDYLIKENVKYDESLEIKATKLDIIARIESQPLPVVKKLPNFI